MERPALRRFALLAAVAGLAAGPGSARGGPEAPGRGLTVALAPAELDDPDLVPPELTVSLQDLTAGWLVPPPRSVAIKQTGVAIDWDGDGRIEATVRSGKSGIVRASKDGFPVPLLLAERGGGWRVMPAAVLRGQVGGTAVEVLDADLDGRYDGAADRLRWDGGAFHRPAAEKRVPTAKGLARWTLTLGGGAWRFTLEPEALPEGATPVAVQGLVGVNAFRNRTGLAPLALDLDWSAGCQKHAEYIKLNPVDGFGHSETAGRPGYSSEGLTAAQEGVMEKTGDPARAVERLTAMLMHRTPFLCDPAFPVGVGAVGTKGGDHDPATGPPGFSVLRAGAALGSKAFPVLVPAPGQKDVPLTLLPEVPTPDRRKNLYDAPRGYPVSVSFLGKDQSGARLTLRVVGKKDPVPSVVFTPAEPIHASFAHNYATAFLVTEEPLARDTLYEVECTFGEGAQAQRLVWRFTTGWH